MPVIAHRQFLVVTRSRRTRTLPVELRAAAKMPDSARVDAYVKLIEARKEPG
ncbi:hypothetical protein [Nocardioides terrisoli]|uniref:hypothetical protein n=1 Tax=Nocardioides terrisoli TaxID=3388267 RepID=UPI00287B96D3|nr:hypothetical protein [Nocardioides marmorisolisilvae]